MLEPRSASGTASRFALNWDEPHAVLRVIPVHGKHVRVDQSMTDTMRPMAARLCASTIKDRRASFNQVALESDIPDRVVLVGIDRETGVRVWVRKYSDI